MRQMVALTLRSAGHEVFTADDGTTALEFARKNAVNLVVTDVHMPKMDGISLVTELRALSTYRFTPILVLTTESAADMKSKGKAAGATGWIVKPFDPERLLATIDRVLA
jgi:two-component system chemotaxis response regulator CheY